jgi:hypothetical protein
MTGFGKLLVFMQLLLSFMMLTWAGAVWMLRVDWAPRQSPLAREASPGMLDAEIHGVKVPGRLDELLASLADLRDVAQARFQSAYTNFSQVDGQRQAYYDWYNDQIRIGMTGRNKAGEEKDIRALVRGDDGLLVMDDAKREVAKIGAVPLKSVEYFESAYKDKTAEIEKTQKELDKVADDLKAVTEEIAGIPGKSPGLRGQLLYEETFVELHKDEMAYLAPQLNARRVDSQVLERRLKYLKERRKELYAALGIEKESD